jgi:predicted ArsR family transcriptional regulator
MRYSSTVNDRTTAGLDSLALLGDPIRRRLYEFVAVQADPVDRDRAATAVDIGRSLAAFHLDRLAAGGLLDVEYHRRSGRTGPGAGRPAKFYRRAVGRQVDVSLPPRSYALAAEILVDGVERAADPDAVIAVLASARATGERLAATAAPGSSGEGALLEVLSSGGYEPVREGAEIRLRNCPFDALVEDHRAMTCSMNLALLEGVASAVEAVGLFAEARPVDEFCCVAFVEAAPDPG